MEFDLLNLLYKWAHRQGENFLTESFAHLIRSLLAEEPEFGVSLIQYLTDNRVNLSLSDAKKISVKTQISEDLGRPDMEIKLSDHLIFIEVKDRSEVNKDQIKRYQKQLARSEYNNTTLILITRYFAEFGSEEKQPDVLLRWYNVGQNIESYSSINGVARDTSFLIINQFLYFLRERGLIMEKVSWELKEGVRSVWNLLYMIEEAIQSSGINFIPITAGKEYGGVWVNGKKKKVAWVGVVWDKPTVVLFHSANVTPAPLKSEGIPYGGINTENSKWEYELDLEDEEVHFFARSEESQIRRIEEFINDGIASLEYLGAF